MSFVALSIGVRRPQVYYRRGLGRKAGGFGQPKAGATPAHRRAWHSVVFGLIAAWASRPQGGLTLGRMCELGKVSRANYYRNWRASALRSDKAALRDVLQRLALTNRRLRLPSADRAAAS